MVRCPACSELLVDSVLDGVPVQSCAAHGTWLDHGELLDITDAERFKPHAFWEDLFRREVTPPRRHGAPYACPHCSVPMELMPYHGVTVDWCREHGVWLDAGEMDAILNNLRLDPQYMRGIAVRIHDREF
jgi:Zn-finger nucleic acid-binding protein